MVYGPLLSSLIVDLPPLSHEVVKVHFVCPQFITDFPFYNFSKRRPLKDSILYFFRTGELGAIKSLVRISTGLHLDVLLNQLSFPQNLAILCTALQSSHCILHLFPYSFQILKLPCSLLLL